MLLLVPISLSENEQGLWFTMMSLGALNRLADMGFLSLVLTYVAHSNNKSPVYNFQLVVKFTTHWRNRVLFFVYPFIFLIGAIILSANTFGDFELIWAWLLYVLALILLFILFYRFAILEGLGFVRQAHFFKGLIYLFATMFTALMMWFSPSINILGLSLFFSALIGLAMISVFQYAEPKDVLSVQSHDLLNYEFKSLIKKTILSWTGGYVGLHGIVPLSYLLLGTAVSGLVGLTLNIFIALQNLANSFLVAKIPTVTTLVAQGGNQSAYYLLYKNMLKALVVFSLSNIIFWFFYYQFAQTIYGDRVLDGIHIIFLYISFSVQIIISAIAIYFRAQKIEPFAWMSVVSGAFMVLVMFVSVSFYHSSLYFMGFLSASLLALAWAFFMLLEERKILNI